MQFANRRLPAPHVLIVPSVLSWIFSAAGILMLKPSHAAKRFVYSWMRYQQQHMMLSDLKDIDNDQVASAKPFLHI